MNLNPKNIHATVVKSMFAEADFDPTTLLLVKGQPEPIFVVSVMLKITLHPQRLEEQRENVKLMLRQLSSQFKDERMTSFLQMCLTDSVGEVWGEHRDADALIALGLGLNLVQITSPVLNASLPGGVPLVTILQEVYS